MTAKERFNRLQLWFEEHMPEAQSELNYSNPFELLVAVMLSAQCTDKRVNLVTPALFAAYPTADTMAAANVEDIFMKIHSVSYPNAKAQHLKAMAERLTEVYGGKIPEKREELETLSGVGRKTANVVCAVIWGQPTMAVDTHIFRVAERIGLTTNSRSPRETENKLMHIIPSAVIPRAHHWLLLHGRYICQARSPRCKECGIKEWCRHFKQQKETE